MLDSHGVRVLAARACSRCVSCGTCNCGHERCSGIIKMRCAASFWWPTPGTHQTQGRGYNRDLHPQIPKKERTLILKTDPIFELAFISCKRLSKETVLELFRLFLQREHVQRQQRVWGLEMIPSHSRCLRLARHSSSPKAGCSAEVSAGKFRAVEAWCSWVPSYSPL